MIMTNTIIKISESDCYGCGSCFNKCPQNAITMEYNDEGFLFPQINEQKCINCGLCLKACPIENFQKRNTKEPDCFAVWANDNLRMKSSSGGMFSLLANYFLEMGGYICGAAFSKDYTAVNHIIISNNGDLDKLRRSKYVQSNINSSYSEVLELLKNDKLVLFSGCPCQVAGLYTFLDNKQYPNLYTVDLACHGANSLKAYHAFLKEKAKGRNIVNVNFREKEILGWTTPTVITFDNGEIHREGPSKCTWYKGFLNGIITRKSCGHCQFATQIRQSDITLADFWGIEKYKAELNDKKGTSLVLINNAKGQELFRKVTNNMALCEKVPYDQGWRRNGQLYQPQKLHPHRDLFFQSLNKYGYDAAIDHAVNYKLDIGVMGWWYNANYGGVATYYALHQLLKSMGYSVLMIDNPIKSGEPYYSNNESMPHRFAQKHYKRSKRYTAYGLRALNAHCSTFIVGSDQMWNYWLRDLTGPSFYLEFATNDKKKIAYGSSFGNQYTVPEAWRSQTAYYVQNFDYVSVREDYAVQMAKDFYDVDAKHVLDPVFLCDKNEFVSLANQSTHLESEPYICCYILNPNEEKRKIIKTVSEKLHLPVKIILDAAEGSFQSNKEKIGMEEVLIDIDEEDWMYYFKNSSYVITDSFHGVCFSIIFEKSFLCLANPERGIQRFHSLLRLFKLDQRLLYTNEDLIKNFWLLEPIEYDPINQILEIKKNDCINWLTNALESPKPRVTSTYDILVKENQQLKEQIWKLHTDLEELKKQLPIALSKPAITKETLLQKIKRHCL